VRGYRNTSDGTFDVSGLQIAFRCVGGGDPRALHLGLLLVEVRTFRGIGIRPIG
jgi:hypothetical protein